MCSAAVASEEVCDFVDNDCDGTADEDFKDDAGKYSSDLHCGTCNLVCGDTIPNGLVEYCDGTKPTPKCVVSECEEDYFMVNEYQCVETPDVTCFPC